MARRVLKLFSFDVICPTRFRFIGRACVRTRFRSSRASVAHGPQSRRLNSALRSLLDDVARTLGVPLALLSRDQAGWRFEAEAFPRDRFPTLRASGRR